MRHEYTVFVQNKKKGTSIKFYKAHFNNPKEGHLLNLQSFKKAFEGSIRLVVSHRRY